MTDKVVDFQSRLAAREVEYAEYDKRMQHLGALFEMMGPVISKMRELGADERAIARALRVIVEELEALEPQRPAGYNFSLEIFCPRSLSPPKKLRQRPPAVDGILLGPVRDHNGQARAYVAGPSLGGATPHPRPGAAHRCQHRQSCRSCCGTNQPRRSGRPAKTATQLKKSGLK